MSQVKFKYQDETQVYKPLLDAVNQVCIDYSKDCTCTSGSRTIDKQKIINKQVLQEHAGAYQLPNGAVYTPDGKCWASAYGKSNHFFCIALDIADQWFKNLTNAQLKKYGLIKPMSHEPWHVQLLEHQGIAQTQKEAIRDRVLKKVELTKQFQTMTDLTADGIAGPITKAKAKEMLQTCQQILGLDFQTAEETIVACMTKPKLWLAALKTIPYFGSFVMNIVEKMGGRR